MPAIASSSNNTDFHKGMTLFPAAVANLTCIEEAKIFATQQADPTYVSNDHSHKSAACPLPSDKVSQGLTQP